MIHKVYKPDGSPDLRNWVIECNGCGTRHAMYEIEDWLVPIPPEMRDFCPPCEQVLAAALIEEWADGAPAVCRRRVRWWRKLLARRRR